jgi:hypothetical protein
MFRPRGMRYAFASALSVLTNLAGLPLRPLSEWRVIRQEHLFNAAAAEFARVVQGLLEGQTGRPVANPEDPGTKRMEREAGVNHGRAHFTASG